MSKYLPFAGAAVALAGVDKLVGNRGYDGMFRHLGWSVGEMQAAAAAETVGGLLMVPRSTRRIGGAMVAGVSVFVLSSELKNGNAKLAASRGLVLLAGIAALIRPGPA